MIMQSTNMLATAAVFGAPQDTAMDETMATESVAEVSTLLLSLACVTRCGLRGARSTTTRELSWRTWARELGIPA